jgi:hypothetical protein
MRTTYIAAIVSHGEPTYTLPSQCFCLGYVVARGFHCRISSLASCRSNTPTGRPQATLLSLTRPTLGRGLPAGGVGLQSGCLCCLSTLPLMKRRRTSRPTVLCRCLCMIASRSFYSPRARARAHFARGPFFVFTIGNDFLPTPAHFCPTARPPTSVTIHSGSVPKPPVPSGLFDLPAICPPAHLLTYL